MNQTKNSPIRIGLINTSISVQGGGGVCIAYIVCGLSTVNSIVQIVELTKRIRI